MNFALASYSDATAVWDRTGMPVSLYSDFDASPEGVAFSKKRQDLIEAIRQLPAYASDRGRGAVSPTHVRLATDFVRELPNDRALPRVAVDEDGDILMTWATVQGGCALTFEGPILHMVVNPGSNSNHAEPTVYNGGFIPPNVLGRIPRRS